MTSSSGRQDYAKSFCAAVVVKFVAEGHVSIPPALHIKPDSALNLPFNEWTEILGSERLTGAPLDRITHHVHILELNGESYRLKESKQSKTGKARS